MPRSEKKQKHAHGEEVRLQAFLAHAGIASRRAAEELIASGRVFVNGESVTAPGIKVRPGVDQVEVEGQPVEVQPITWVALHKPKGYVTTRDDQYGRKTVYDLLPERYHGLFHVGRLDRDSEGLILLTNDGTLANRMLHPSFGITKEYWADVDGKPTAEEMHRLTEGVEEGGDILRAESVRRLHQTGENEHRLSIVMVEGKNREVRRMLEALGHPVRRLIRRRFGPVAIGELKQGKWRVVTDTELAGLRKKPGKATEATGGDHPPRRATHGEYSDRSMDKKSTEKKPSRPASGDKPKRNAAAKAPRPFAKTGARGKPGDRDVRPGRPHRKDDERDAKPRRASGSSAGHGPKRRDDERPSRPAGKPTRRDAEETPRGARGPVRRDDEAPRRGPVRRDDDSPRRPVRRDEEAPRGRAGRGDEDSPRRPVRRGDDEKPRGAQRGGRPGAPVRRSYGDEDASAGRPSGGRPGGQGRPTRRDEADAPTRRPAAGDRPGEQGRPTRRDEEDAPSRRSSTGGRPAGQGRPTRRDNEDAPTRRPSTGGRSGGQGRPTRRDDGDAPTRRPSTGGRPGGQGRPTRRDDGDAPRRPTKSGPRGGGAPRGEDDEPRTGRRTGQGGGRDMTAEWPRTGRPERTREPSRDDETPRRGGAAGGGRRPSGGDSPRGGKPGGGKPGGGRGPGGGGRGGRPGGSGARGGKGGPRGGGRGRA
ncbi:MAG TPA: pseudouridine synthase [Longimicrobium sp.]|nr:pseudouridine synthase [Longimicrobium sp.]